MKKLLLFISLVSLLVCLSSCGVKIESVSLKETEQTIIIGDTYQIACTVVPAEAQSSLEWSSSDPSVAAVDDQGLVTAVSEGTADISVSVKDTVYAVCSVTVSPKEVTETAYITIDGMYVNEGYRDNNNEALRLVYLAYTVKTSDQNLSVSDKTIKLSVNDTNQYFAEHIPGANYAMNSYYYSSYIEDVFSGTELKVLGTFKIPANELNPGNVFTFSCNEIPETEKLRCLSDSLKTFASQEELAKTVDPEGFKEEQRKMEDADDALTDTVKSSINGYRWSFFVNSITYQLEFFAPNRFQLTTAIANNGGTYSVKKGYVIISYSNSDNSVKIPYSFKDDGSLDLHVTEAFDVAR